MHVWTLPTAGPKERAAFWSKFQCQMLRDCVRKHRPKRRRHPSKHRNVQAREWMLARALERHHTHERGWVGGARLALLHFSSFAMR
jgi:hypothetical protein